VAFVVISGLVLPTTPFFVPQAKASGAVADQAKLTSYSELAGATEQPSKRTANSRVYETAQGKGWAEIYGESIHYLDGSSAWQPINNNLTTVTNQGDYIYKNEANRFNALFTKNNGAEFFQFQQGSDTIYFALNNSSEEESVVSNNEITYPEVTTGTDVKYIVQSDGVKGEIVIKNDQAALALVYNARVTSGLSLSLTSDGDIKVIKNSSTIWLLPRPTALNSITGDVVYGAYQLSQINSSNYQITLNVINAFLPAAERRYPLVVDPSIVIVGGSNFASNYVIQGLGGTVFPSSVSDGVLPVGRTSYGEGRSFLKYDVSGIPSGAQIDSAVFSIATHEERTSVPRVKLYNVTQSWDPATLTWNNQPSVSSSFEDSYAYNITYAWWNYDVTNLVKGWKSGSITNNGLTLRSHDPSITRRWFLSKCYLGGASQNCTTGEFKPYIMVTYNTTASTPLLGTKPWWRYVSTNLGFGDAAVNIANGNLTFNFNDVSVQDLGSDVTINHTYNSLDSYDDNFGYGWTISANKRLVPSQDRKTVLYIDETNTPFVFRDSDGNGNYVDNILDASSGFYRRVNHRPNGLNWGLKYDSQTSKYIAKTNNKNTLRFDSAGKILEEEDRNGNKVTYQYTSGRLSRVTGQSGKYVELSYDGNGKLQSIKDYNATDSNYTGGEVIYTYDNGDLKTITQRVEDDPNSVLSTVTFNYTNHKLTSVIDGRTNTTSFTYDGSNRVTDVYDAENKRTKIVFDSPGLTKVVSAKGFDTGNQESDYTTDYSYRTNPYYQTGLVYKEITPPLKNNQDQTVRNTIQYDYNDDFQLQATTDAAGKVDASAYDDISGLLFYQFNENNDMTLKNVYSQSNYDNGDWRLISSFNGNATQTIYTYDANGNLIRKGVMDGAINYLLNPGYESTARDPAGYDPMCVPSWPKSGVADFWCGAWGNSANSGAATYGIDTSTYTDGLKSQKVGYTNAQHATSVSVFQTVDEATKLLPNTTYTLTWKYKQEIVSTFRVQIALIHYDELGQQIGNAVFAPVSTASTSWANDSLTFTTPTTNPNNGYSYWTSDVLMRATTSNTGITATAWFDSVKLEKGSQASPQQEKVTSFTYTSITQPNPTGLALTETTPENKTMNYDWDSRGNLLSVTDPLTKKTSYTYDLNGNKLSKVEPKGNETLTNANDFKFTYTNDVRNRLKSVTEVETNRTTSYTYDPNGNLLESTTPNGLKTTYTYDKVNRAEKTINPYNYESKVQYDSQGNPKGVTDPNGQNSSTSYDATDRLTKETSPSNQNTNYKYDNTDNLKKVEEANKNLSYNYDASGQLTSETNDQLGSNQTVQYQYDKAGNLTVISTQAGETLSHTYSAADEVTKVTVAGQTTTYTYNLNNQLSRIDKHNTDFATFGYDNNARVTTITNKRSSTEFLKYEYQYDANGNKTSIIKTVNGTPSTTTYEYDNLNQLKKVITASKTTEYFYDAGGNITRQENTTGVWTDFTYDGNRLLKKNDSTGAVEYYSYDAAGNMTTRDSGDNISFLAHFNNNLVNERYDQAGTLTGTNTYGTGYFNGSLQLGSTSYVSYPTAGNINRLAGTIEFWLPGSPWCDHCGAQTILDSTVDQNNYIRIKITNNNHVGFQYVVNGTSYAPLSVTIGRFGWHHVAFSWDNTSSKVYLNGNLESTGNGVTPLPLNAKDLVFGATMTATPSDYLGSAIDEVSISPTVKTGSEITADYNASAERTLTHITAYNYDSHDYLTKITEPNGTIYEYKYDSNKRRTKRIKTGATDINYQYDGDKLVSENNNDGSLIAKYRYDSQGQLLSIERSGSSYYPVLDGLGGIVAVRDSNGNTVNSYEYDEWGRVINRTEQFPLPIRFAGYWQDNDTGIYHLGARWYDPTLFRFTSIDPHPGDQDDSVSMNEYIYVRNNPIILTDHDGDIPIIAVAFLAWSAYDAYQAYKKGDTTNFALAIGLSLTGPAGKGAVLTKKAAAHIIKRHAAGSASRATKFPASWSNKKILKAVKSVANDKKSLTTPNTRGRKGSIKTGTYGGIRIKTVIRKGKIITGYPR